MCIQAFCVQKCNLSFQLLVLDPNFSAAVTVEEEGFCYHRAGVLEYIQTGRKLSSFGTSLPAEEKWGHVEIKKRKHKRDGWPGRQYKFAKADDYLEASRWPKRMTSWNTSCSWVTQFW